MKQILPKLFLFLLFLFILCFLFSKPAFSAITFTISNPVKEGDYFIVDASISGIASVSAFVQGKFTSTTSPSYFGYTWGQNEEWVNYVGSTNKSFITQNLPILMRNTSQKIWIKPNYQDKAYKGPGEYFLKLERFTGASDSSTGEDAVITVSLTEPLPTPTQTPTEEPTNTPNPTPDWTPNPTKTPTPTIKPTPTKIISFSASISAVLGESTDSASISADYLNINEASPSRELKYKKSRNYKIPFFIGLVLAAISGSLLYFRHRKD